MGAPPHAASGGGGCAAWLHGGAQLRAPLGGDSRGCCTCFPGGRLGGGRPSGRGLRVPGLAVRRQPLSLVFWPPGLLVNPLKPFVAVPGSPAIARCPSRGKAGNGAPPSLFAACAAGSCWRACGPAGLRLLVLTLLGRCCRFAWLLVGLCWVWPMAAWPLACLVAGAFPSPSLLLRNIPRSYSPLSDPLIFGAPCLPGCCLLFGCSVVCLSGRFHQLPCRGRRRCHVRWRLCWLGACLHPGSPAGSAMAAAPYLACHL